MKMQEILSLYEKAAGAKMNLFKMVIIPLALPTIPQWVIYSGYKISASGEIQRYLGALIGYQLRQSNLHNFYLDKISKQILGWSNRLLSLTGKILSIQHILQSITMYYMMYMATHANTMKQINSIFKDFLQGFDREEEDPFYSLEQAHTAQRVWGIGIQRLLDPLRGAPKQIGYQHLGRPNH